VSGNFLSLRLSISPAPFASIGSANIGGLFQDTIASKEIFKDFF